MNLGVRRGQGRGDTDGSFRKGVFACGDGALNTLVVEEGGNPAAGGLVQHPKRRALHLDRRQRLDTFLKFSVQPAQIVGR